MNRHLDQCDNGCHAPAVKWTSQGFVFWQMKEDWAHAAWHLLTALGFFYFGMGVV